MAVEIDLPDTFALGPQRYLITAERFTDKAHTAPPVNLAALLHLALTPGGVRNSNTIFTISIARNCPAVAVSLGWALILPDAIKPIRYGWI